MAESTNLSCPRCQEPLRGLQSPQVPFDACHSCGGIWLGQAATDTLLADHALDTLRLVDRVADRSVSRPDTTATDLPCPVCRDPMDVVPFPEAAAEVDLCRHHGWWFDRDELRAVVAALNPQGVPTMSTSSPAPAGRGHGSGPTATAAAVTGAAVVGAAVGAVGLAGSGQDEEESKVGDVLQELAEESDSLVDVADLAVDGAELAGEVVESTEVLTTLAEMAGSVAEVGAGGLEGVGEILLGVLEVLGGVAEGL